MKLAYTSEKPDATTGAKPLTPESASAVLNSIATECDDHIVLFDLDSTLLDNRGRNATIMREFGELQNNTQLAHAKAEHWLDWSARNAMTAIGLVESEVDSLVDAYIAFWQQRFFTSEYCQYDTQIVGAADFVTVLQQSGCRIRYLTGRHEQMRAGTIGSLTKLGFPTPGTDDVSLIMKPKQNASDDDFKKNAMSRLDRVFPVLAAFDNEPSHINAYRKAYPEARCIHLHTDHSMRPVRLLGGIVSITNFVR